MQKIYLVSQEDETFGDTPVLAFTSYEEANKLLATIDEYRLQEREELDSLNSNLSYEAVSAGPEKDLYISRYKNIQAKYTSKVMSLHEFLRLYYSYKIVEVDLVATPLATP